MSDQRTALVLGGGGITGIAWEIGVLAGLADAGVDLASADLVVGTSAGSVVGAQVTGGAELEAMFGRQLEPPAEEKVARMSRSNLARYAWAMLVSRGRDEDFRRRVGSVALAAEKAGLTPTEQERLDVIGSRLVGSEWPDRQLVITAVDAETGEFRTFDRHSGVPLLHAVAASCAVPGVYPPVTIGGRRYAIPTWEELERFVGRLVADRVLIANDDIRRALSGDDLGLSRRSWQRRFPAVTGLRRKEIQRLDRSREAYRLLSEGMPPVEVAVVVGYADQAHLTRELRRIRGETPARILAAART